MFALLLTSTLTASTVTPSDTLSVSMTTGWAVGATVTASYIGSGGNGDEDYTTTVVICKTNGTGQMKVVLADGTIGVMSVGATSFTTPKFVYTLD